MNKKYRIITLIFILIISTSLFYFIETSKRNAPEVVLFRVLDNDKIPIVDADCKADISSNKLLIEDKSLKEIENIYEYIQGIHVEGKDSQKGFYELETELNGNEKEFEIRIVCISQGNKDVGYTILNNTNLPCEIKEGGRILIC